MWALFERGGPVMYPLAILSVLTPSPLEEPANPLIPPNPAKAPWYFLWLQEIVTDTTVHIGGFTINGAFLGGVLLPGILVGLLTFWPWIDRSPRAAAGHRAALRFSASQDLPGLLRLEVKPFLADGRVREQRLDVWINGHQLQVIRLNSPEFPWHEIRVPRGKPVKFILTASDVIHGFYLPDYRVKMDAIPGRLTTLWVQPEKAGTYTIFCSVYCGDGHSKIGRASCRERV